MSERRAAAVLVTLVSDYGSLIERMAPAEARALVARYAIWPSMRSDAMAAW